MTNLTGDFINTYHVSSGIFMPDFSEHHCPLCGSGRIDYKDTDYAEDLVFMRYACAECGSEFEYHYDLIGAYIINDEHNKED